MNSNEDKLNEIRSVIIAEIAENIKLYGISETVGLVMATIYYHNKPITLDELSEEMGMSKMSMSNAVRELLEIGIVHKVHVNHSRKHHYIVEQDYYQFFIDLFCYKWGVSIYRKGTSRNKLSKELQDIIDNDNDENVKEKAEKLLDENKKAIEYFNWITRLIEFFDSQEVFKHIPKTEGNEEQNKT